MTKKISILVPCFNSEKYIFRCLESCKNQTYKDLEIIVVDDGSNDSTLKIVEENFKSDKRFKIYSKENEGISKTRNFLIEKMNGEYGYFLDSDDWIDYDCIETFMNKFNNQDLIINSSYVNKKNKQKNFYITDKINKNTDKFSYIQNNTYFPWNILFKKKFILDNNLLFCEESSFFEDAGIMTIWFLCTNNITFINSAKYHYNISNSSSLSHQKKMSYKKINDSIIQLNNLYTRIKSLYIDNKPEKEIIDQLSFYHCVIFSYIEFQSNILKKEKKDLKLKLKKLEKSHWRLRLPKRYWKFWYFILYRIFFY